PKTDHRCDNAATACRAKGPMSAPAMKTSSCMLWRPSSRTLPDEFRLRRFPTQHHGRQLRAKLDVGIVGDSQSLADARDLFNDISGELATLVTTERNSD